MVAYLLMMQLLKTINLTENRERKKASVRLSRGLCRDHVRPLEASADQVTSAMLPATIQVYNWLSQ